MKEIIIASLLLAALLAGIAVNSRIINDFYDTAVRMTKELPPAGAEGSYEAVCAFDVYWHEKKTAVSFSVSYDDVERITEKVRLLKVAALRCLRIRASARAAHNGYRARRPPRTRFV